MRRYGKKQVDTVRETSRYNEETDTTTITTTYQHYGPSKGTGDTGEVLGNLKLVSENTVSGQHDLITPHCSVTVRTDVGWRLIIGIDYNCKARDKLISSAARYGYRVLPTEDKWTYTVTTNKQIATDWLLSKVGKWIRTVDQTPIKLAGSDQRHCGRKHKAKEPPTFVRNGRFGYCNLGREAVQRTYTSRGVER